MEQHFQEMTKRQFIKNYKEEEIVERHDHIHPKWTQHIEEEKEKELSMYENNVIIISTMLGYLIIAFYYMIFINCSYCSESILIWYSILVTFSYTKLNLVNIIKWF